MGNEHSGLEQELEQAMQEIQDKLTGETWEDIRMFLKWERETTNAYQQQLYENIEKINEDLDEMLQEMLDLARPETEAEFWRMLHLYRLAVDSADECAEGFCQTNSNLRYWLRPYVLGLLTGSGSQFDFIK